MQDHQIFLSHIYIPWPCIWILSWKTELSEGENQMMQNSWDMYILYLEKNVLHTLILNFIYYYNNCMILTVLQDLGSFFDAEVRALIFDDVTSSMELTPVLCYIILNFEFYIMDLSICLFLDWPKVTNPNFSWYSTCLCNLLQRSNDLSQFFLERAICHMYVASWGCLTLFQLLII